MAELTSIPLWTIGFLWAFWGMYVLVMGIYRAHLSHRLKGLVLVLSLPFVAIGFLMDVFAKYICDHLLDVFDPSGNHC